MTEDELKEAFEALSGAVELLVNDSPLREDERTVEFRARKLAMNLLLEMMLEQKRQTALLAQIADRISPVVLVRNMERGVSVLKDEG